MTRLLRLTSFVATLGVWACTQRSPTPAPTAPGYVLPGTATYSLASTAVGDTFQVVVALPRGYPHEAAVYPVVVALDADLAFAAATQVIRLMQYRREIPPSVVVGVGYGALSTALGKRRRDFTPTAPPDHPDCGAREACGGAERFLRFLRQEMLPFVAARYHVDVDRGATLFGASLGGLFGGFVLAREPEAFSYYVLGSPSVGWDGHWLLDRLAETPPSTGRVFIGVGGAEGPGVADASRLAEALRRGRPDPPTVRLHVFEGEKHMSVQPMVLSRGLRVLAEGAGPAQ